MAEAPDRPIGEPATRTSSSTADIQAAIRETRGRLATRLTRTADHVRLLLTSPSSADTRGADRDLVDGAISTLAVVGRTKRAWAEAKQIGLVRRAAIGAAVIAVAATLAVKKTRP